MGKKDRFDYFAAFERQVKVAAAEADILIEAIEGFSAAADLVSVMERAHEMEHEGDEIAHSIYKVVGTDFITPIEREDIIDLVQSLDSITDGIESVIQRFYMYDVHFMHDEALEFATYIKKSCTALGYAMEDFRNFKKSKTFKQLIVDVNTYEEEGDALYLSAMRNLHTKEDVDVMHVLRWSRIYSRIEKCCDACEHAADVMNTILLKNL